MQLCIQCDCRNKKYRYVCKKAELQSRQAISGWEGDQSLPDLERILKMSELFGVSTDMLIKDEVELSSAVFHERLDSDNILHILTLEEANNYLALKEKGTKPIAFGVMLCVGYDPAYFIGEFCKESHCGARQHDRCLFAYSWRGRLVSLKWIAAQYLEMDGGKAV